MFLRIYELKDKFKYLFHEQKKKKEVIRKISACIKNKFNGFTLTVSNSREIEKKKDFFPVDIIYKPVRSPDDVTECFFSTNIRFAYRGTHSDLRSLNQLGHSKLMNAIIATIFSQTKELLIDIFEAVAANQELFMISISKTWLLLKII